jgi:hypothetical protein
MPTARPRAVARGLLSLGALSLTVRLTGAPPRPRRSGGNTPAKRRMSPQATPLLASADDWRGTIRGWTPGAR